MNIVKKETPRYDIRTDAGVEATILIFEPIGPHSLTMMVYSDYGSWAHSWPSHGCESGKHFILELAKDRDYLVQKLTRGAEEYDHDATMQALKERVEEAVKNETLKEETAKLFLEYLDEFPPADDEHYVDADVDAAIENSTGVYQQTLRDIVSGDGYLAKTYALPHDCCQFFETIFVPVFVPFIKAELGL